MSIWDIDNYTDAVSDVGDKIEDVATSIADAGDFIGGILKTIAPIISMYPGLGTAFSVAIYAAGAATAGDDITDAAIGTVSSAMPPGIPRLAFDGGTTITREIASGRNVVDSAIDSCRKIANASSPQAAAAFNAGLELVKNGKIDARAINAARDFALTSGGQAAAVSFDAAVSIAKGDSATDVVLNVARGYIRDMGGALAAGAFDMAVAMGYGQTLQEAGYIGLQTYVKGNDNLEKMLNFVDMVGRAESLGMALDLMLQTDLAKDFMAAVPKLGIPVTIPGIDATLKPYIDSIKDNAALLNIPAGDLAKQFGIDEAIIRTAQALMRSGTGTPDTQLLQLIYPPIAFGKIEDQKEYVARNRALRVIGNQVAMKDPRVFAKRLSVNKSAWYIGFDLGTGACLDKTEWGPGQEAIGKTASWNQASGFRAAGDLQHMLAARRQRKITGNVVRSELNIMAYAESTGKVKLPPTSEMGNIKSARAEGAALAASNATIKAGRDLNSNPDWQYGFDVATKISQGCETDGPGQQRFRSYMGPDCGGSAMRQSGYDVGQAIQLGISRQVKQGLLDLSGHPTIAAGQLGTSGLVNSNMSDAAKSNVMQAIVANPAANTGAKDAISTHGGLWGKIKAFFGL